MDSLGTNHSVVCCDVGQLTLKLGFELVTPSARSKFWRGEDKGGG